MSGSDLTGNTCPRLQLGRLILSALAGTAAAGAPYALLFLTVWDEHSPYRTNDRLPGLVLIVAPLFGSMIFTLLSVRRLGRAEWLRSVAMAFVIALAVAGAWGSEAVSEGRRYESPSFGWAVAMGAVTLLLGLGGVGSAAVISYLLSRRSQASRWKTIRPWHIGALTAVIELAAVAVVAVAML